jgi:hypothetical protein
VAHLHRKHLLHRSPRRLSQLQPLPRPLSILLPLLLAIPDLMKIVRATQVESPLKYWQCSA